MKRPLYSLSAGDLGSTANEVEQSLQHVLELSAKWGTVLLIDECDVFLERRSASDISRNKLVSGEFLPSQFQSSNSATVHEGGAAILTKAR